MDLEKFLPSDGGALGAKERGERPLAPKRFYEGEKQRLVEGPQQKAEASGDNDRTGENKSAAPLPIWMGEDLPAPPQKKRDG